eukprot:868172-Prorocentrum_minimum.AAC.2
MWRAFLTICFQDLQSLSKLASNTCTKSDERKITTYTSESYHEVFLDMQPDTQLFAVQSTEVAALFKGHAPRCTAGRLRTTVTTVVATASHYTLYNYNTLPRRFLYRTLASHACVCALA